MNLLKNIYKNKFLKYFIITVIVLLLLELTVFNFGSYALLFGSYAERTPDINSAYISGFDVSSDTGNLILKGSQNGYIQFGDINTAIETIYIDIETDSSEKIVSVYYNEETNQGLRTNAAVNTIKNNEHSKYALCSFSGEVETLGFRVTADENETIVIKNIVINKPIPINFSAVRFFVLLSIVTIVNALCNITVMTNEIRNNLSYKSMTAFVIVFFLVCGFALSCVASNGIVNDFKNPDKNQVNAELVDAFAAGQVHLIDEVPRELLELDNPYDWSERRDAVVSYKWDHCLYDGQYYSYYGIAPVLLIFLPYHIMTGSYFPSVWAICIFGLMGILFLGMTYYEFTKKFFPAISNRAALCGLIITELISGIWFCLPIANFYEIAQSSGFAFVCAGAYFMLTSNAISGGRLSNIKACAASIYLALAVLCRPTLAVYCIVALIFIFFGSKKAFSISNKKLVTYLCASLIPFVIIGGVQMIYNYLRFDSFFDFGIQYSLTINDFTATTHHVPLAVIGFYNFIFAFPKVIPEFPFFDANYSTLGVNGYYFTANTHAIGLLYRALPIFAYCAFWRAYKLCGKNNKNALLLLATCVVAPIVIIYSIWESGYGVRYSCDFAWQILFGALAIAFVIYSKSSAQLRKISDKLMILSLVISIVTNFALIYNCTYANVGTTMQAPLASFGRLFEFWNLW